MQGGDSNSNAGETAAPDAPVSERGNAGTLCRNCGALVLESYCGQCGQSVDSHRRSVRHLLDEFIEHIVSFDSRILRTARALLFWPGELALAFREGRTQRHVPPVRLFLFVSLFFFLGLSAARIAVFQLELATTSTRFVANEDGKVVEEKDGKARVLEGVIAKNGVVISDTRQHGQRDTMLGMKVDGRPTNDLTIRPYLFSRKIETSSTIDPGLRDSLNRFERANSTSPVAPRVKLWMDRDPQHILETIARNPSAVNDSLTKWIHRLIFALLPVFAVILAILYWKQRERFYFVDHVVFSLTFFSFCFVVILLAVFLAQYVLGSAVALAAAGAIGVYLILAMKRFYEEGWGRTARKFLLLSLSYGVLDLTPAIVGTTLAVVLNL